MMRVAGNDVRPAVCVTVDMDTLQDYAAVYRLDYEEAYRGLEYERVLPRLTGLLEDLGIKATFFVVARDAGPWLAELTAAGHEVASHSLTHPNAFAALPRDRKRYEVVESKAVLEEASGAEVRGFRAPAYDLDDETVELLAAAGYQYTSSICPTWAQQAFKWVLRLKAGRWTVGHGTWRQCWLPRQPFVWSRGGIAEVPVTVVGRLRLPWFSSILQLTEGRVKLFERGHRWLRGKFVNYQLHIAELLDLDNDGVGLEYQAVPYLRIPFAQRHGFVRKALTALRQTHEPRLLREEAT